MRLGMFLFAFFILIFVSGVYGVISINSGSQRYANSVFDYLGSEFPQDISKECSKGVTQMNEDITNCEAGSGDDKCELNSCMQVALTKVKGVCCQNVQDSNVCEKILGFQYEGMCALGADCRSGCSPGTTKCSDGECGADCTDKGGNLGCDGEPDGVCSTLREGCGCEDCEDKQDGCWIGSVCTQNEECSCHMDESICEKKASVSRAICRNLRDNCAGCGGDGSMDEAKCKDENEKLKGDVDNYNLNCGVDGCFPEKLGDAANCCPDI